MKPLRSICLLFILIAVAIIFCFWFGFLFGKETQRQADLVAITEARLSAEASANNSKRDALIESGTSESDADASTNYNADVQTNYTISQPQFYLKSDHGYVSIYVYATDELYFETDLLVDELPIELQEDISKGLEFYELESVYLFLENYSS